MFLPQEIVRKKRDREELSADEISSFVRGIMEGTVDRAQIAAFTMAVYLNGMTPSEQVALTLCMRDSGTVLEWKSLKDQDKVIVEKHSSGGVGDEKVTLIVTPLAAACGVISPNLSGRALGHCGGEIDLLESIPGYTIEPTSDLFHRTVEAVGTAIIGPTPDLAPADRAMYHVRDITATVESIPLITSSILSKKLAAGADAMVMTVPFGTGAYMKDRERALQLAAALLDVAGGAGLRTVILISDLEQVLGDSVGNGLEIVEVIDFLQGTFRESRLQEVVVAVAAEMVLLAGITSTLESATALVFSKLADGEAALRFGQMVAALGGPHDLLASPGKYLPTAEISELVYPDESGIVAGMDCFSVGMAVVAMGFGRARPQDVIDYAVGISAIAHVGDRVGPDRPLCRLHARSLCQWQTAAAALRGAYRIGTSTPPLTTVLHGRFATS
jgi:thymidine phosphorylase